MTTYKNHPGAPVCPRRVPEALPFLIDQLAPVTRLVIGVVGVRVRLELPFPAATTRAPQRLFLLPDDRGVEVFGQPLRSTIGYIPSAKDRDGDSVTGGVVESGAVLEVMSVPLSDFGRSVVLFESS